MPLSHAIIKDKTTEYANCEEIDQNVVKHILMILTVIHLHIIYIEVVVCI